MRKLTHISFSSHDEVLFRSEEDINYAFNCFALACLETGSRPLADGEMTTHVHFGLFTDDPKEVFYKFRYPYSRYFNSKYKRTGRLGERHPFCLEVEGLHHTTALLSYIYRQALHHGLSDSPFGYKHNSVNVIFKDILGKPTTPDILKRSHMKVFLPRFRGEIPDRYRMDKNGLLLREDVIDTSYVEELYISPRNFLYQMNRLSSDQWKNEQMEDKNGLPPVSLEDVEPACYRPAMSQLILNESGRNFRNRITDLELCGIIDNFYLPDLKKHSIYEMSESERKMLGNRIFSDMKSGAFPKLPGKTGLPDISQIRRCAVCHDYKK